MQRQIGADWQQWAEIVSELPDRWFGLAILVIAFTPLIIHERL